METVEIQLKQKMKNQGIENTCRRSIRLAEYDYSQAGYYFVTVCVNSRRNLFGEIESGKIKLNGAGWMVDKWWKELEQKYSRVILDEYCVMPNHMHGIIQIVGADLCVRPNNDSCVRPNNTEIKLDNLNDGPGWAGT